MCIMNGSETYESPYDCKDVFQKDSSNKPTDVTWRQIKGKLIWKFDNRLLIFVIVKLLPFEVRILLPVNELAGLFVLQ